MEGAGDCDRRPPAPPRPALRGRFRRLTCSDSASWAEGWRAPRLSGPPGAGAGERAGLRVAAPHRPPTLRRGAARVGESRASTPIAGPRHWSRVRADPRPLPPSGPRGSLRARPCPERLLPRYPPAAARVPERASPPASPTLRAALWSPARAPPPARLEARALERAGPAPCPARPPPRAAPPAPGSLPGPGRHFPPKLPRKFASGRLRRQEHPDPPSPSACRGSPECMGAGRTGPGG
ncbi:atherin-like [Ursus maritimus]|uniref:Atherin-like n=1 Tax=Ursus maritimus TaxID=29073 RepID=A0A8M1GET6_URSMA|nr:atherin-like [Ursus maritimus]